MGKPKAIVDEKKCLACGGCISVCPQDALLMHGSKAFVTEEKCTSCARCALICPSKLWRRNKEDKKVFLEENHQEFCTECGGCVQACPDDAIQMHLPLNGEGIKYRYG